jgi:predicted ATPase
MLSDVAAAAHVVLVVDDLQWADAPTLLLLRHVAAHQPPVPLLLIATHRTVGLTAGHPLLDTVDALQRLPWTRRIHLDGLDPADVRRFLEDWAGTEPPDAVVDTITAETSGNPFFLGELLRHLAESGGWTPTTGDDGISVDQVGVPPRIREVVERRLARLTDSSRTLLSCAAGFGDRFRVWPLPEACGIEEEDVIGGLDEAVLAGLVVEEDADRYRFSHGLIRHCAYGLLSGPRRVRLHRRIAAALAMVAPEGDGPHLAELAHHSLRSVTTPAEAEAAGRLAAAAARWSARELAYEEATRQYERAIEALAAAGPGAARLRSELEAELARFASHPSAMSQ